jgi:hypothetical protein
MDRITLHYDARQRRKAVPLAKSEKTEQQKEQRNNNENLKERRMYNEKYRDKGIN